MKILMLADVLFPDTVGGAGRVACHLSRELGSRGHQVRIVTRNPGGILPPAERLTAHCRVHRFRVPHRESPVLPLLEMRNSYGLTRRLLKETTFDAVCVHQSLAALGPLLGGLLKTLPLIYTFHSPWHEEFLVKNEGAEGGKGWAVRAAALGMRQAEGCVLRRAARVVVLSRFMGQRLAALHRIPQERVVRIPGGVDLDRFRLPAGGKGAARDDLGLPRDKTLFLTVRNLVPRMGLEPLIEAFNRSPILREKGLLLIGGRGALESSLKARVRTRGLAGAVRFLGHIPEKGLPAAYQAADFFVLPTRRLEGFGLVILEALASGTPVLGTPVGAIPEVLGPFDTGLLFRGTGWEDMQEKLEGVIRNPGLYRYDPETCRGYVAGAFSWERVAERFEETVGSALVL